jgi:hypothetical protein
MSEQERHDALVDELSAIGAKLDRLIELMEPRCDLDETAGDILRATLAHMVLDPPELVTYYPGRKIADYVLRGLSSVATIGISDEQAHQLSPHETD